MKIDYQDLENRLLTIEEFERLPDDGWRLELVRGRVVREPLAGFEHGEISARMVDPDSRTVTTYRSRHDIRLLAADGELDGADVLPGFRHRVAELFGR